MKVHNEQEYTDFVIRLFKLDEKNINMQLHAAVGICGEAGELIDAIKKTWVYNKPLDRVNILEELGDILFYFTAMAATTGYNYDQIMDYNMQKLLKRYPSGYSDAAAQARADKS